MNTLPEAVREAELFLASYDAAIEDPEQDPALVAQQDAMPLAESLRSVLSALSTTPADDAREAVERSIRFALRFDLGWKPEDARPLAAELGPHVFRRIEAAREARS